MALDLLTVWDDTSHDSLQTWQQVDGGDADRRLQSRSQH